VIENQLVMMVASNRSEDPRNSHIIWLLAEKHTRLDPLRSCRIPDRIRRDFLNSG